MKYNIFRSRRLLTHEYSYQLCVSDGDANARPRWYQWSKVDKHTRRRGIICRVSNDDRRRGRVVMIACGRRRRYIDTSRYVYTRARHQRTADKSLPLHQPTTTHTHTGAIINQHKCVWHCDHEPRSTDEVSRRRAGCWVVYPTFYNLQGGP